MSEDVSPVIHDIFGKPSAEFVFVSNLCEIDQLLRANMAVGPTTTFARIVKSNIQAISSNINQSINQLFDLQPCSKCRNSMNMRSPIGLHIAYNRRLQCFRILDVGLYCITPIFRVEDIFAIFANLDFARNYPPAKFSSREIFLPAKVKL